jgi:hypothetical protein
MSMSQPGDSNGIAGWIIAGVALLGILWAVAVRIFSYVTRSEVAGRMATQDRKFLQAQDAMKAEFKESLEQQRLESARIAGEQKAELAKMHGENQRVNEAIFRQLREQDKAIARIEGALGRTRHSFGPGEA